MHFILALGTNLGKRTSNITQAMNELAITIPSIKSTSSYESPALLKTNSPDEWNLPFLNTIAYGNTNLAPQRLLDLCQAIENKMGRDEDHPIWSPRNMDIDILFYENVQLHTPTLTIPHPEIQKRLFVMLPLAEIEPNFLKPLWQPHFQKGWKDTVEQLMADSPEADIPIRLTVSEND